MGSSPYAAARFAEIGFAYFRVALDVVGRVFDQRRALSQHGDPFGQGEHDMHVVFDDRHGDVALFADLFQQIDGVVGVGPRHAGGRFVQQQQTRFLTRHIAISNRRLSPRDREAAVHVPLVGHVDVFQHVFCAFVDVLSRRRCQARAAETTRRAWQSRGSSCFPTPSDRRKSRASETPGKCPSD